MKRNLLLIVSCIIVLLMSVTVLYAQQEDQLTYREITEIPSYLSWIRKMGENPVIFVGYNNDGKIATEPWNSDGYQICYYVAYNAFDPYVKEFYTRNQYERTIYIPDQILDKSKKYLKYIDIINKNDEAHIQCSIFMTEGSSVNNKNPTGYGRDAGSNFNLYDSILSEISVDYKNIDIDWFSQNDEDLTFFRKFGDLNCVKAKVNGKDEIFWAVSGDGRTRFGSILFEYNSFNSNTERYLEKNKKDYFGTLDFPKEIIDNSKYYIVYSENRNLNGKNPGYQSCRIINPSDKTGYKPGAILENINYNIFNDYYEFMNYSVSLHYKSFDKDAVLTGRFSFINNCGDINNVFALVDADENICIEKGLGYYNEIKLYYVELNSLNEKLIQKLNSTDERSRWLSIPEKVFDSKKQYIIIYADARAYGYKCFLVDGKEGANCILEFTGMDIR